MIYMTRPGPAVASEPAPLSRSLGVLAKRLGAGGPGVLSVVFSKWDTVVGEAVAAHVQPKLIEGETLVVMADHPAWATQARRIAPQVMARLAEMCDPEPAPKNMRITVKA
ncbi:MAG: DciA family protein [Acidimicrobiales bacterium]